MAGTKAGGDAVRSAALQQHWSIALGLPSVDTRKRFNRHITPTNKAQSSTESPQTGQSISRRSTSKSSNIARSIQLPQERVIVAPVQPTLAQRLCLLPTPAVALGVSDWQTIRNQSTSRNDSKQPCPICLEKFGTRRQVILSCSHVFHKTCLKSFERHSQRHECPMCRQKMYQALQINDGALHCQQQAAITIQSAWRGYWSRVSHEGPFRRKRENVKRLSSITARLVLQTRGRNDDVDAFLAVVDESLIHSRRIINSSHRRVIYKPLSLKQWKSIGDEAQITGRFDGDCAICLVSVASKTAQPILVSCGHVFHVNCLKALERFSYENTPTCPVCRSHYQKQPHLSNTPLPLPRTTIAHPDKQYRGQRNH